MRFIGSFRAGGYNLAMSIVENRKAFHDYFIEERVEAGIALEGWEVKSIRAGRANLKEAYVVVRNGEIMLVGAHISPLAQASTHVQTPVRYRSRNSSCSISLPPHAETTTRPGQRMTRIVLLCRARPTLAPSAEARGR